MEVGKLLQNPIFQEAMSDIETHYCEMWKAEPLEKNRETIWLTIQNLRRLKIQLDGYYSNYEIIKKNDEIDAKNRLKKVL